MTGSPYSQKQRVIRGDAVRILRDHRDINIEEVAKKSGLSIEIINDIEAGKDVPIEHQQTYLKFLKMEDWDQVVHTASILLGSYGSTLPVGLGRPSRGMEFLLELPSLGQMLKGVRKEKSLSIEIVTEKAKEVSLPENQAGLSPGNLSLIENDKPKATPVQVIRSICQGLGMPKEIENPYGWIISEYIKFGLMPLEVSIRRAQQSDHAKT